MQRLLKLRPKECQSSAGPSSKSSGLPKMKSVKSNQRFAGTSRKTGSTWMRPRSIDVVNIWMRRTPITRSTG